MKRILFFMLLCSSLGANTNWNNTDNWDTNIIPNASDDVIIPAGSTVTLNVPGNVRSIDIQGISVFDMNTNFTFSEASSIGENVTFNWSSGTLNGITSTLTNAGVISLIGTANKSITGGTTLNNVGTLNITSSGDLLVSGAGSVLNNTATGIIDMQADGGNFSWSVLYK